MYLRHNKRKNLKIALYKLDGILIKHGETKSFGKLVGRQIKAKGYLEGLVLKQDRADKDTGGGLCKLGNLLFWISAHSPLTITERHRHGFDVFPDENRKLPFDAGATLSYNHIDFQVKKETEYMFQFKLWLDETHLHGSLNSDLERFETYSIEERNAVVKQQYWGG